MGLLNMYASAFLVYLAAVAGLGYALIRDLGRDGEGYRSAAAVSDGTPCAEIAIDILKKNGTAADGVIASLFCSGVVNPHSMGIGGGFLLTYYDKEAGKAYSLVSRERAPAAAHKDMFKKNATLSAQGGLAVAVPGEIPGNLALYERFGGGVPWEELIEPSAKIAEEGFPVHFHLAMALQENRETILEQPSMSVYVSPNTGDVYQEGDLLRQPQLAASLRILQKDRYSFQNGTLAENFVRDVQALGGIITMDDMRSYEPNWEEPIEVNISNDKDGDMKVYSVPPPGSGAVLGFMLNLFDEFKFNTTDLADDTKILTHQRIIESFKYAYAQRTFLGDAAYVDVTELLANLTSDAYAAGVRASILDTSTSQDPSYYGAYTAPPEDGGTSHQSVVSSNGNAAAATGTINLYFGALRTSVSTGIVLNNEMDDFSSPGFNNSYGVPPSPANFIEPGKRPLSSMCPAIVVTSDGNVRLVTGAAGGTRITSAVALTSAYHLWLGLSLEEALATERVHHQLEPMYVIHEEGFDKDVIDGLEKIGHEVQLSPAAAVVGAISREGGSLYAAADRRKAGQTDGY